MVFNNFKMMGYVMSFWKITKKMPDSPDLSISYLLLGPPGDNHWIYFLQNENGSKTRLAASSADYEIGAEIHEGDMKKVI
jgi:hypothetical protein